MTAVAFQQALGSQGFAGRWIVNIILAAALLSLFKCFNGNFVAASRLFFAMGRRGMITARAGTIHAKFQTPSAAVLCVGLATAACMLLGDAILVPVTEVGSVACAIGWSATCAAGLALASSRPELMSLSGIERAVAAFGLVVSIAMILMKIVPAVPGHFTVYEWLALGIWVALGAAATTAARGQKT
jgi:amino acid transporter